MLYYFSGTGNSRYVAKQLAAFTKDAAQDLVPLLRQGSVPPPAYGEAIGLVFPIHAWAPPKPVMDFARLLKPTSETYVYAVCTCGDDAGQAMGRLKRRVPLKAAWSIAMPNNYIPMYDADPPAVEQSKIALANERLPRIARLIDERVPVFDVWRGKAPRLKTGLINPLFRGFALSTKPFSVDESCIGCGLCAKRCPAQAIQMVDGRPVYTKKHCTQCMACISYCPAAAIQYGESTRGRRRYHFDEGTEGEQG